MLCDLERQRENARQNISEAQKRIHDLSRQLECTYRRGEEIQEQQVKAQGLIASSKGHDGPSDYSKELWKIVASCPGEVDKMLKRASRLEQQIEEAKSFIREEHETLSQLGVQERQVHSTMQNSVRMVGGALNKVRHPRPHSPHRLAFTQTTIARTTAPNSQAPPSRLMRTKSS